MSQDAMNELYQVVKGRKEVFTEGSYTCYLFDKGLDKILKKCGEECSETIIAAKNLQNAHSVEEKKVAKEEVENEICDLIYHLMVLMVEQGVALSDINEILSQRSKKIGNLKVLKETDRNS